VVGAARAAQTVPRDSGPAPRRGGREREDTDGSDGGHDVVTEPQAGTVLLRDEAAGMRRSTAPLMKEDPMTTHDFRPAGAAPRPHAATRRGRTDGKDASTRPGGAARAVLVAASVGALLGLGPAPASAEPELRPAIVFASTRANPGVPGLSSAEIYLMLMKPDGTPDGSTALRRLTNDPDPANHPAGDGFPVLSPDGKQIVFDSNRNRAAGEPLNTSDLFLMKSDGTQQRLLTRGSSATWSPDGKRLAFHASASGTGRPATAVPGPPTCDSDIFVAKVGDLLDLGTGRTNLTNSPDYIDYDPDWSPDGKRIAFVRRPKHDEDDCAKPLPMPAPPANAPDNELYVINADGTGLTRLTFNTTAEAAPDWSPDGRHIAYMCRPDPAKQIENCVMQVNADGSTGIPTQLTNNDLFEGTPIWSPDGRKILFGRQTGGTGTQQLFVMDVVKNADGTWTPGIPAQLTNTAGVNLLASWGVLK
jgi:TolB protein